MEIRRKLTMQWSIPRVHSYRVEGRRGVRDRDEPIQGEWYNQMSAEWSVYGLAKFNSVEPMNHFSSQLFWLSGN